MPNVTQAGPYNYEITRPEEHQIANQPAVRVDYQPSMNLRLTGRYSGWSQKDEPILGTIPGWNDTRQYNPFVRTLSTTVNYSLNSTTFLEGTYGFSQNSLTGCALAQADTGPTFCRAAFPMNDIANLANAGLAGLPFLFPDAGVIDPSYFAYQALNGVKPPIWDGTRISMLPNLCVGHPHHERSAQHAVPRLPEHQQDPGRLDQPDEGHGPAQSEDGVLQHVQLQSAAAPGLGGHDHVLE